MILVKDLDHRYGDFQLKVNNLEIEENELILIKGESGSGKTTFANILSGTIKADKGTILLNGETVDKKTLIDNVEYLKTNQLLVKNYTIYETLYLKGIKEHLKDKLNELIDSYLVKFGLFEKKNDKIKELSGGEKQRVLFICALLTNKNIIIMDEPDKGLDNENISLIYDTLKEINKTIIVISHKTDFIEQYVNKIIVFNKGNINTKIISSNSKKNDEENRRRKRNIFLLKYDFKESKIKSLFRIILYTVMFALAFILLSASNFISNIQNEERYANYDNYFTGYNYNVEIISNGKKLHINDVEKIIEKTDSKGIFLNFISINSMMPVNDNIEILYGKNISNNDEIILALNPSNYYINKDKYDSMIDTYTTIAIYNGFTLYSSTKVIEKEYKIVGIAKSNYETYSDNHYFCSKEEYNACYNLDLKAQYNLFTENKDYKAIPLKNAIIDNSLDDYVISYKNYNGSGISFLLICQNYSEEYAFDFINGTDDVMMNEKTYNELFDQEALINILLTFDSKKEKDYCIKLLKENNIGYNDLSYEQNYFINKTIFVITIVLIITIGIIMIIILEKSMKDKLSFYRFCGFSKKEIVISEEIINLICLSFSNIFIYIIARKIIETKYDDIKHYYLFNYLTNYTILSIFVIINLVYIAMIFINRFICFYKNK